MYFSTIFRGSILIFLLLIFRPRLTAALPTGLAWALVKVSFSSELAIVVGADKYLLFPAWQGNEWEGRGTHCDRGVRDTNKPAGSFLPHWHLKTPIHYLALHWDRSTDGQSWKCVGAWWRWRNREWRDRRGVAETVKKKTTEKDTGLGGKESAFEKESGEGSPLRAVYMTDHQRNSQDNGAKRIHNTRQCRPKEERRWCYEYTCPSGLHLPTYPLLHKGNLIVIFPRQNKTGLSRGSHI